MSDGTLCSHGPYSMVDFILISLILHEPENFFLIKLKIIPKQNKKYKNGWPTKHTLFISIHPIDHLIWVEKTSHLYHPTWPMFANCNCHCPTLDIEGESIIFNGFAIFYLYMLFFKMYGFNDFFFFFLGGISQIMIIYKSFFPHLYSLSTQCNDPQNPVRAFIGHRSKRNRKVKRVTVEIVHHHHQWPMIHISQCRLVSPKEVLLLS